VPGMTEQRNSGLRASILSPAEFSRAAAAAFRQDAAIDPPLPDVNRCLSKQ
jgi:hypothetical protein